MRSGTTGLVAQAFGADDRHEVVATFFRALIIAIVVGLAVLLLKDPLLAVALRAIGGSEAVQAATADYWHVRVLATPFALTNYVVLGWLIGLGRAGYGLLLQTILNGLNIVLSIVFVHSLGLGVPGVGWASFAAETATAVPRRRRRARADGSRRKAEPRAASGARRLRPHDRASTATS